MGFDCSFKQFLMKKIFTILLIFVVSFSYSQTTIYLNIGNIYQSTVSFNAGWNVTTGAKRYYMAAQKDGSTIASKTSGQVGASAVRKCLIDQFITAPLAAQTITGTLDGQIRFNQSSTSSTTGQGFVYLRVINADNSVATEVGSLTTTNLTTTLTNRTLVQLNVGTLNITAGQRLCVDIGFNESVGTNTTRTGTTSRGSSAATNLAVDNTTTTANTPWIKFSQTLIFLSNPKHFF